MLDYSTIQHLIEGDLQRAHVDLQAKWTEMVSVYADNTATLRVSTCFAPAGSKVCVVGVSIEGDDVWFVVRYGDVVGHVHAQWLAGPTIKPL